MKFLTCLLFVITANAADLPHFDVASVKPTASLPDGPNLSQDSGRIHYVAASFRQLVARAYLQKYPEDVQGPAWIDSTRFNVDATFAPGSESQVPEMLQDLLAQRFRLRTHTDAKPTKGYALRVCPDGAGILKPAAESHFTPMLAGNPLRIEAKSSGMDELCRLLAALLKVPVVDETGLSGKYTYRMLMPPSTNPDGYNDNTMSAGILASLKQLGLTAVSRIVTAPHVVVDSADQTPQQN